MRFYYFKQNITRDIFQEINNVMVKMRYLLLIMIILPFVACKKEVAFDANGTFEADEVIVSAQQNGQLIAYSVEEGKSLTAGEKVGQLDVQLTQLQKEQVEASIIALNQKTGNTIEQDKLIAKQLDLLQVQRDQLIREKDRTSNLVKADAATQKQLDDINANIEQLDKQIAVTKQQISVNNSNNILKNRSVLSEQLPLRKSAAQLQTQIEHGQIINPVTGTVLVNYALRGEMQSFGKPLYKIANIDTLFLRAYITGEQWTQIKLGQTVKVQVDYGKDESRSYSGNITWIASKAEFTPKSIQTKDERANLVYAIKIKVINDGILKIGMYGSVNWSKI